MLFNSLQFFVFFPVVYLLYRIMPFRWQNRMLLIAGYVFYGWWDVRFLFLIAFSTTVDFTIGLLLSEQSMSAKERWTASSVPHLLGSFISLPELARPNSKDQCKYTKRSIVIA